MGFKYLNVERQQGIERLVLNRPDVRNAFNEGMIAELTWWADSVSSDRSVRLVYANKATVSITPTAPDAVEFAYTSPDGARTYRAPFRRAGGP